MRIFDLRGIEQKGKTHERIYILFSWRIFWNVLGSICILEMEERLMSEDFENTKVDNLCMCITHSDYCDSAEDPVRQEIERVFGKILKKFYSVDGETIVTICERKDS